MQLSYTGTIMKRPYLLVWPSGGSIVADLVFAHKDGGACFISTGWDLPGTHPFHVLPGPVVKTETEWRCADGAVIRELKPEDEEFDQWTRWSDYKQSAAGKLATDDRAIQCCKYDGALIDQTP